MSSSRSFSNVRRLCSVATVAALLACACAASGQAAPATHVIRVWGYNGLQEQLLRWESDYRALHPDITFDNHLHGAAAVMAGLYDGVADVAVMGREIWPVETMAYQWVYQQQPFGVAVATTGFDAPGESFTPAVLVNKENPIANITASQLDAIYGSEHRNAPANARTWGDLGLTGEWADKPIHAYGFGGEDALGVYFRHDVLKMDFKPNPESRLLSDRDGSGKSATERIAQAVAGDRYAIGYARLQPGAGTKALTLDGVAPDEATVASHRYEFARMVWIYFRRMPDKPLDPAVDAFVRYLLSEHAQALVGPKDKWLPLTPALARKQVEKLDAPMPKIAPATEDKE